MRELKRTGWIPGRGRQLVSNYLTKDLKIDWRYGAAWFEERLIDHDTCSNWGNWSFVAGRGSRNTPTYNIIRQSHIYDTWGTYIKKWVKALQPLKPTHLHTPWVLKEKKDPKDKCETDPETYPMPFNVEKYVLVKKTAKRKLSAEKKRKSKK